jgi:RNA polymerase-interacting CarD/CdnL/TRCF family regulator
MNLKIGDRVVHPQYGVGHVVKLEEREFEPGVTRQYYEISIPGSTLWVPLDQPTFGLRKLTVRSEIDHCRQILSSRPLPLTEDARLSNRSGRLKEGRSCPLVVRDLSAYGAHKPIMQTSAFRGCPGCACHRGGGGGSRTAAAKSGLVEKQ